MTSPSAMKYAVSVGVIAMVARRMMPVSPLPPTVAQNSVGLVGRRGVRWRTCAVGGQQVHRADVVAEAAGAVVVLAVDVAGDRAADGDLPGAGQHRHPQPERQRGAHQLVEVHAGVDVDERGRPRSIEWIWFSGGHVDDEAAAVLGVVAVGAAQSAGDARRGRVLGVRVTASTMTSGSGVDSTRATDGAVRPQPVSRWWSEIVLRHRDEGTATTAVRQRSRKITARCTTKLITVAVPCAMTNATGTRHGLSSNSV